MGVLIGRLRTLALMSAAALLVSACGGDSADDGGGGSDSGGADRDRPAFVEELDVRPEPQQDVPDVRAQDVEDASLASFDWASPSHGHDATIRVDLLALRAKGDVATLWLAFTADYGSDAPDANAAPAYFSLFGNRSLAPRLELLAADPPRIHDVVGDPPVVGPEQTLSELRAPEGDPQLAYATFAAPPKSVTTVDLRLLDTMPPIRDVPVER